MGLVSPGTRASPPSPPSPPTGMIFIPCLHENFSVMVGGPGRRLHRELLRAVSESHKQAQIMKCSPLRIALTFPVSITSIELADRHRNPRSRIPFCF